MPSTTALPLSLSHAAAQAHITELRAEAEQERLARAATGPRRIAVRPVAAAVALRHSIASALAAGRGAGRGEACPTC